MGNGFGVSKGLLAEGGLVTPKSTGLSTGGYVMPGGYVSIIGASVSEGVPTEGGPVSPDETGLLTGEVVGVASVVGTFSDGAEVVGGVESGVGLFTGDFVPETGGSVFDGPLADGSSVLSGLVGLFAGAKVGVS